MSLLQFSDAITAPNVQIWNNAAFCNDNANTEDTEEPAITSSWCAIQPIFTGRSVNLEPDSSKENRSPESHQVLCKSPISIRSVKPTKPLHPRTGNSQAKPLKSSPRHGFSTSFKNHTENDLIAAGIEEIEREISRLTSKLAELRLQQAMAERKCSDVKSDSGNPSEEIAGDYRIPDAQKVKDSVEKQNRKGRIVPAKFMEQKKNTKPVVFSEQPSGKIRRRGLSLGPSEIVAVTGFRQPKPEITPLKSVQSRRKSCYSKFQMEEIREEQEKKTHRRRSSSLSPKSQRSAIKIPESRSKMLTVGAKKPAKRDGISSFLQPKKLFREGDSSGNGRDGIKPSAVKASCLKNARVVASRYNQIPPEKSVSSGSSPENDRRKRSLPENEQENNKRGEKKRGSIGEELYNGSTTFCFGKSHVPEYCPESHRREKRRWENPRKLNGLSKEKRGSNDGRKSSIEPPPTPIPAVAQLLPRIRTVRSKVESPRDSGCVKREADRIGKKSFFNGDENSDEEELVLQMLSFTDE